MKKISLLAFIVVILAIGSAFGRPLVFQKRGVTNIDLDAIKGKVSNLKTEEVASAYGGLISSSAIKFQKLIFPKLDNLNINQLMEKAQAAPDSLIPEFMPIIVMAGLGFVFAILTIIVGFLFWCCRCCCNGCGGRKPKKTGYSRLQILTTSLALFCFSTLIIVFSLLIIVYSGSMPKAYASIKDSALLLADSVDDFSAGLSNGGSQIVVVIDNYVDNLAPTIGALNIKGSIDSTLGVAVDAIKATVTTIAGKIANIKSGLLDTQVMIGNLSSQISGLNTNVNNIQVALNNVRNVTILGTSYVVNGLPTISPFTAPNLNSSIDLSVVLNPINTMPNLTALSNQLVDTYENTTGGISTLLVDKINNFVGTFKNGSSYKTFSGSSKTLGSALDPVKNITNIIRTQSESAYNQVLTFDSYRNYAFLGISIIIIIGFAFALLAVIFQKGVMAALAKPDSICMSFFVWILFSIFFILAFVLNTVRFNLKSDIAVGPAPKIDLFNTSGSGPAKTLSVSLGAILDSCVVPGSTIFNASFNSKGDNFVSILGMEDFFVGNATNTRSDNFIKFLKLRDQLDVLNVSNAVAFTTPDLGNIDAVLNLNTSNLATISVSITSPMNISSTKNDIDGVIAQLGPTYFWPDCTTANIASNVTDLNNKILAANSNPPQGNLTAKIILDNYVVGGQTFSASAFTGDSNAGSANNLAVKAAYDKAFYMINFEYNSTIAANQVIANLNIVKNNLDGLNNALGTINGTVQTIQGKVSDVLAIVNATKPDVTSIKNQVSGISSVISSTVVSLKTYIVDEVMKYLSSMYEDLLNVLFTSTKCGVLAVGVGSMINAITVEFGGHINLFWLVFFLLGIFLFMGFITTVKATKRLGSKKKVSPEGKSIKNQ